jgi:hypothetical protein
VSDASEESMNHGTREDKEEEDRYRTEHLVAVCRNMCMDIRVPLSTVVIVARLFRVGWTRNSDAIHSLQYTIIIDPSTNSVIPCPILRKSKPSVSMSPVASRSYKIWRCPSQK